MFMHAQLGVILLKQMRFILSEIVGLNDKLEVWSVFWANLNMNRKQEKQRNVLRNSDIGSTL